MLLTFPMFLIIFMYVAIAAIAAAVIGTIQGKTGFVEWVLGMMWPVLLFGTLCIVVIVCVVEPLHKRLDEYIFISRRPSHDI